jgi:hypothetical protein
MEQYSRASNYIYESVSYLYCRKLWLSPQEEEIHHEEEREISHRFTQIKHRHRNIHLRKARITGIIILSFTLVILVHFTL